MTPREFLDAIQGYYGLRYTDGQKPFIAKWVASRSEAFLRCLFDEITREVSGQFRTLPDIAIFEQCTQRALDVLRYNQPQLKAPEPIQTPEEAAEQERILDELRKMILQRGVR